MTDSSAPQTGFADVHGAQLYYEVGGQGHALVLLHAGVSDHRMWDATFPLFAQHYRTIRYDLRGFGRSVMPPGTFSHYADLGGLLAALSVARAYVVGVSVGGRAALEFTLVHPEQVAALVPVAAGIGSPPSAQAQQLYDQMDAPYEAHDVAGVLDLELRLWLIGPSRSPAAVAPALQERFRAIEGPQLQKEFAGEAGSAENLQPPPVGRLGEIHVPTLVIAGAADLPDVLDTADRLAAGIAGARKVIIPDTAHMVPLERPAEFARLVLDFLGGL